MAILMAVLAGLGVLLAVLMGQHREARTTAAHRAAGAAAYGHTIPTTNA